MIFTSDRELAQAIVSNGTVYASGNIGCDRELKLVEGGVQAQTVSVFDATGRTHPHRYPQRAALKNLAIVLKASGSGLEHILKANVYLTNLPKDFAAMNEVYTEVGIRSLDCLLFTPINLAVSSSKITPQRGHALVWLHSHWAQKLRSSVWPR